MQQLDKSVFEGGMRSLIGQFGDKAYSPDRVAVIYDEVKKLYPLQFKRIVRDFLSGSRYAPLPKDFRDAAGSYISQNYESQKSETAKQYKRLLSDSQRAMIFKALLQGMEGNTEAIQRVIRGFNSPAMNQYSCKVCDDSGLVFAKPRKNPASADYVFNCNCHQSAKNPSYQNWNSNFEAQLLRNNKRTGMELAQ